MKFAWIRIRGSAFFADPDPESQNNADPDPKHWFSGQRISGRDYSVAKDVFPDVGVIPRGY